MVGGWWGVKCVCVITAFFGVLKEAWEDEAFHWFVILTLGILSISAMSFYTMGDMEMVVLERQALEIKFNEEKNCNEMWRDTSDGYQIVSFEKQFGRVWDGEQVELVRSQAQWFIFQTPSQYSYEIVEAEVSDVTEEL